MDVAILAEIRFYREGLATVLDQHPDIAVVGTAANDPAGLAHIRELRSDIVLIDMAMRGGVILAREFRHVRPDVKIVALGVGETEQQVLACAEAGIAGYVSRDGSLTDLVTTLGEVCRGEVVCSPRIVAGLFRRLATLAAVQRPQLQTRPLTMRQLEVIELVARGLSNREIAEQLCIELATVKNHVHSILEKLQIRSRAEAALWARGCSPAELRAGVERG